MEFLLEPLEVGTEFNTTCLEIDQVSCDTGYACDTGKVQASLQDEDDEIVV